MLWIHLQCTGRPPQQRIICPEVLIVLRVRDFGAEVGKGMGREVSVNRSEKVGGQGLSEHQGLENHGGEFDTVLRAGGPPRPLNAIPRLGWSFLPRRGERGEGWAGGRRPSVGLSSSRGAGEALGPWERLGGSCFQGVASVGCGERGQGEPK